MLWLRGLVFTLFVPGIVGGWLPYSIAGASPRDGAWMLGWAIGCGRSDDLFAVPAAVPGERRHADDLVHASSTRDLRRGAAEVVLSGIYRHSRNPMYLGVLTAILGAAYEQYCRQVPRWFGKTRNVTPQT